MLMKGLSGPRIAGPSQNVERASEVADVSLLTLSLDADVPDDSDDGFGSDFGPPSSHDQDACSAGGMASIFITGLAESETRVGNTPVFVLRRLQSKVSGQLKS